ncbi:MAG: FAD-binding protein [Deltaproteobacteria bacterium]|nr:FAD-binding protein [Deltaproteobacteria bacterium]MBW2052513.1 FAD-binding protein [Deltaproteobacteria bacterium]MBW2141457.1 FAD-binding protein [Deltaproteobacteria bacterium]MBW2322572.1 FAD-binding protein [Deltaproteobacteria bacterium]
MRFRDVSGVSCDVLIIGGGGASLRAAIEARKSGADVLVVSKVKTGHANNTYISAGVFAATGWGESQDDAGVHLEDTVIGGRFLNNQKLVAKMTREAGDEVPFLEKCGVSFIKREDKLMLGHVPGHKYPRHVHALAMGGRGLILPLKAYAEKIGVRFIDHVFITKLFTGDNRIAAAAGITKDGSFLSLEAKCVILGTGGFGHIYLRTNNAPGITGDGHALAYDLGLQLKDIEFVQFYPTAAGIHASQTILYEAIVSGAGALLKNAHGESIITKHGLNDPKIMTRDRLAQAIMNEILEGADVDGGVILDLGPVSEVNRFRRLLPTGWSEEQKEIIVSPTTHFCMGGVVIDENAETSVPGLFAAGEVCAGVHGANRLAGNALTEVFAMGGVAGRNAAIKIKEIGSPAIPRDEIEREKASLESPPSQERQNQKDLRRKLKKVMWYKAGIVRREKDLQEALGAIEALKPLCREIQFASAIQLMKRLELQNMLLASEMVCRAALLRTESRGAHFRSDYPEEDNANWLKNIVIRKTDDKMSLESAPVSLDIISRETLKPSSS